MCAIIDEIRWRKHGYNPGEEVQQQHLCPRELITLVRCREAGLHYKKAAYLWR